MAGDDEARARATLVEMQSRISQGAHVVLGVDDDATPEQIRSAFLGLTKQFHPARFGRLSNELQRLSNEVFLGIKAAHEGLLRALGVSPKGGANQSGGMLVVAAEGSSKMPSMGPVARAAGTQHPIRGASPAISRTLTPARIGPRAATPNQSTPPFGTRAVSPTIQRTPTPPLGTRAASPTVQRTPPPAANPTPPFGVRVGAPRPATPPTAGPTARPTPPPASSAIDAKTTLGVTAPQKTAPVFDERVEFQQALDHMTAKNWTAARQVLNGLAARVPSSKQYRAMLCCTRGREAQAAGKGVEAQMEFQRALELDPDSSYAKSALAELLKRR